MKKRKKILFISNMYPSSKHPDYGIFVKNTELILHQAGFNVKHSVVVKENSKMMKILKYICCYCHAIILGVFWNPDCINIHYISHTFFPIKIIKKIRKQIKIVGSVYGEDVCQDLDIYKANKVKTEIALEAIDCLIVPSKYFEEYVLEHYCWGRERTFVFPSGGVSGKVFYPKDKGICRYSFGFEDAFFYVGFASRIVNEKGWDVFLEAAAYLKSKGHSNMRFVIVGEGNQDLLLEDKTKQLKLEECILRFPMLKQEMLAVFFNAIDLFCFPTRRKSESLGLVGLEAMSCGTLCVISDELIGPRTYAKDGVNSLMFESKNAYDLANKIEQMCDLDDWKKSQMRQEALKTANEYRPEILRQKIFNIFSEVLK